METKNSATSGSNILNPSIKTLSDSFQGHWQYIYNYAYVRIKNHQLAEDVAQETLLKAWRNRHAYDPKIGKVRTWLYAIANNAIIDRIRLGQNHTLQTLVSNLGSRVHRKLVIQETPEDIAIENETTERMNAQVNTVLEILDKETEYGTLLRHKFFNGLIGEEFATVLGVARGTVRWRIFRAKKLFKEEWQKRFAIPKEE